MYFIAVMFHTPGLLQYTNFIHYTRQIVLPTTLPIFVLVQWPFIHIYHITVTQCVGESFIDTSYNLTIEVKSDSSKLMSLCHSRRVMIDGTQATVQTHIELPDNISSSQGRLFQIGRFLSNNLMFTESLDVGVTRMVINEW